MKVSVEFHSVRREHVLLMQNVHKLCQATSVMWARIFAFSQNRGKKNSLGMYTLRVCKPLLCAFEYKCFGGSSVDKTRGRKQNALNHINVGNSRH